MVEWLHCCFSVDASSAFDIFDRHFGYCLDYFHGAATCHQMSFFHPEAEAPNDPRECARSHVVAPSEQKKRRGDCSLCNVALGQGIGKRQSTPQNQSNSIIMMSLFIVFCVFCIRVGFCPLPPSWPTTLESTTWSLRSQNHTHHTRASAMRSMLILPSWKKNAYFAGNST